MYTEQIGNSEYRRIDDDDWEMLKGKRVNGHGKIEGCTVCDGEHHPSYVITSDDSFLTLGDLMYDVEWDGRHNMIDI